MPKYSQDVSEIKETLARLDERLAALHEDVIEVKEQLKLQNGCIEANAREIAQLKERQGALTTLQVGLSALLSAIAAWLGIRR